MEMRPYLVNWGKTYHASGQVTVWAESEEEAERIVDQNLGDYEGSMQYDPNEDYVEVAKCLY